MQVKRLLVEHPFFSLCIPQYNRTSFLIEACKSLAAQTFKEFELCISDDCSTGGREAQLLEFLERSGLSFVYKKQPQNQRYDGNPRASISLARGRFCFLLGNDDAPASSKVLEELHADIQRFGPVGVVITNYEEFASGRKFRRMKRTELLGSGPSVAVSHFRNFSFVSGILLDAEKAQRHATDRWDGSEMYQMFLGCRIIAAGTSLLGIDRVVVRQGIRIPGELVDSYARKPRVNPCPILERRLPMEKICPLVADAVGPYLQPMERQRLTEKVVWQFFSLTYPFWIVEYRRVQSWRYALGVCLGLRLRYVCRGLDLSRWGRMRLILLYGGISILGLAVPGRLFRALQPQLYSIAKWFR